MSIFRKIVGAIVKKPLGFSFRVIQPIRKAIDESLTVFMFHEVSDQPSRFSREYNLAVTRETFYRQASWIRENFEVIHPSSVLNGTAMPQRAALISFDDGFLSAFENGLPILRGLGMPSVVFLNMQAIQEQRPILSAVACYMLRNVPNFADFAKSKGLSAPFHLTLTPSILNSYVQRYGAIDNDLVLEYQGKFAELATLKYWDDQSIVVYGNHLFDHWNAPALSLEELEEQYKKNETALSRLKNWVNIYAFTNGRFSTREVDFLRQAGAGKLFSSTGGVNRDSSEYVLGRLCLDERDKKDVDFWFQIGRALINDRLNSRF